MIVGSTEFSEKFKIMSIAMIKCRIFSVLNCLRVVYPSSLFDFEKDKDDAYSCHKISERICFNFLFYLAGHLRRGRPVRLLSTREGHLLDGQKWLLF